LTHKSFEQANRKKTAWSKQIKNYLQFNNENLIMMSIRISKSMIGGCVQFQIKKKKIKTFYVVKSHNDKYLFFNW
jgi:hypothetical protein